MPNPRMKDRRVVHKSTAGILTPIPEAVDLVGNPPPGLTTNTVAPLTDEALRTAGPVHNLSPPLGRKYIAVAFSGLKRR